MSEIASARINSFAPIAAQTDFAVPPSEETVFILNTRQLQDIIQKATEPLQDRLSHLEDTVAKKDETIATLEARISLQEDNGLIQLRLINDLREAAKKEAQPMQKDRGEILRALLVTNGGKMLAKDARKKMRLDEATFSRLLDASETYIEKRAYHLDKRQSVLIIK